MSFPLTPNIGDTHTVNGRVFAWDGAAWIYEGQAITLDFENITNKPTGDEGQTIVFDNQGKMTPADVSKGMTANEKTVFNRLVVRQAEDDFNSARESLNYPGGAYDVFSDLSKIQSTDNSFDVVNPTTISAVSNTGFTNSSNPESFEFNANGSKIILLNTGNGTLTENTLNTPYILSSGVTYNSFINISSITGVTGTWSSLKFSPDGMRMYLIDRSSQRLARVTLSAPYLYNSVMSNEVISLTTLSSAVRGVTVDSTETYLFITDQSNDRVIRLEMGTPGDLSSITLNASHVLDVSERVINPYGIDISEDDKTLIVGNTGSSDGCWIGSWGLPTASSLTSAVYIDRFSVISQRNQAEGIRLADGDNRFYFASKDGPVYQSDISKSTYEDIVYSITDLKAELKTITTAAKIELKPIQRLSNLSSKTIFHSLSDSNTAFNDFDLNPEGTKGIVITGSLSRIKNLVLSEQNSFLGSSLSGEVSLTPYGSGNFSSLRYASDSRIIAIRSNSPSTVIDLSASNYEVGSPTGSTTVPGNFYTRSLDVSKDGKIMTLVDNNNIISSWTLPTSISNTTQIGSNFTLSTLETVSAVDCIRWSSDGLRLFALDNLNSVTAYLIEYSTAQAYDVNNLSFIRKVLINTTFTGQDSTMPTSFWFNESNNEIWLYHSNGSIPRVFSLLEAKNYLTSGSFLTTPIDLTNSLLGPPKELVISADHLAPINTSLSVTISDGSNGVTIQANDFDSVISCNTLTSRTLTATWNFSTTDSGETPQLSNYGIYFIE